MLAEETEAEGEFESALRGVIHRFSILSAMGDSKVACTSRGLPWTVSQKSSLWGYSGWVLVQETCYP